MFFKNKKNFFIFAFIFLIFSFSLYAGEIVIPELTDDQIVSAKNNGMINAMCFILEILTGKFARAIFALFVVYIGWSYLVGTAKDHKPVLPFILAIAITIGSTNLANILTGTDYSCKSFKEALYKDENTIYNKGQCVVSDIDIYQNGQEWLLCGNNKVYNIANCNGVVTNESDIKYGGLNQVIALNKCQDGYFRDLANKFLFYSCSPQGDSGLYYFKLVYPTNQIDIDKATCKKACSVKDLDKIVRTYNIDYNSLLDVPGNSRKDGNYYTQGYKFTANCKTGFLEYREENNDGNIEYIEDKDGLSITCSENGTFSITGSCKSRCDLNDTSLNNNVSVWNKCDENGCNKTSGVIFNYGDILEINSCKDGYFLSNAYSVNTKIKCSDNGSWVLLEQTTEKDGTITTANSCIKKCKVAEIDNYTNIEKFVMNCSTGDTKCNPTAEITGETLLEQGQSIKIESCITNTDFDFIDTANGIYMCNNRGEWELQSGTSTCYPSCNASEIFAKYKNISFFVLVDDRDNVLEDQRAINANQLTSIKNGQRLMILDCFENFSFNKYKTPLIVFCEKGKLSYKNTTNYCMNNCIVNELFTGFDRNNLLWEEIDRTGDLITNSPILNQNTQIQNVNNGSIYKLTGCASGYSIPYNSGVVVECNSGKWNIDRNQENVCMPSCPNNILGTSSITSVFGSIKSFIKSDLKGNPISNSVPMDITNLTGTTNAGEYVTIKECADGFGLSEKKSPVFKCINGTWSVSKNADYRCYNKCKKQDLLNAFGNSNFETIYESKSTGTIIGDTDIVSSDNELLEIDSYYVVSTCRDGYRLLNNKSRIVRCNKGKIEIYSNMDNICIPIQQ